MNDEAVGLLCQYIKLDTTNPPGNEYRAVEFLGRILNKEGIKCKTYEPLPGRVSIRAEIAGSANEGALILLHHTDVIAANRDEWSFDPFGGQIVDDYICGRGALDTKSLGIMQLLAFLEIKRKHLNPIRSIIFLATADEESGADLGVERLLREHPDDFKADLVLNEGSYIVRDLHSEKLTAMISPGEKGPCWLRLKRKGLPGHGSTPHGHNALERMVEAINRLSVYKQPAKVTPIVAAYFKKMAEVWDFLKPYALDGKEETLLRIVEENGLFSMPQINAMLRNTVSLNVLKSGSKVNVIPSYAEAEVDIRLLPGVKTDDFIKFVKGQLADDEIQVEPIMRGEGNASDMDTESYRLLEKILVEHYPGAITAPYLMLGTTDSRFFRGKGIASYGLCPAVVPMDHLRSIHGIDEKIAVESLIKGTEVYKDIVKRLCA